MKRSTPQSSSPKPRKSAKTQSPPPPAPAQNGPGVPKFASLKLTDRPEIKNLDVLKTRAGRLFTVQKPLGEGVFGIVFQVTNKKNEKLAAKVMKKTDEPPNAWRIELEIMERVATRPHANIIQLHSSGTLVDPPAFCSTNVIFTNVLGPSLLNVLDKAESQLLPNDKGITFPIASIRTIGHQILSAMCHLEELRIYHLDLKPENVYFIGDGKFSIKSLDSDFISIEMDDLSIQIGDFGCSKFHSDPDSPPTPMLVQTQNYRAPEVFVGLPISTKADVWSFGAMMCEMYTGELLFFGTSDQNTEGTQFEMMQRVVEQYVTREMWNRAIVRGSPSVRRDACRIQRGAKKFNPTCVLHMNMRRNDTSAIVFFEMLREVLVFDPEYRPSFDDVINHQFFKN